MPASRPSETQFAIQSLRAIAAAMVVFHHASDAVVGAAAKPSVLAAHPGLAALGACGVDVFFVISGFIIFFTMTRKAGLGEARTFIRDRFFRVIPLYWFWTSVLVLAMVLRLALTNLNLDLALAVSSYLLIPYEKLPGNPHPLLDPGWTLSFEVYFYAVTALLVALLPYRRRLAGLLAVLALVQTAAWVGPVSEGIRQWLGSPLVYEFLAGAGIATAIRSGRFGEPGAHPRAGLALIGLGTACLAVTALMPDAIGWRVPLWGIPSVLVVLGAVLANAPPRSAAGRLLFRLGTASYSLYLSHGFAMMALGAALKRGYLLTIDPDLLVVGLTIAVVGLGSATYPVVERPLLALVRGRRRPPCPLRADGPVPAA